MKKTFPLMIFAAAALAWGAGNVAQPTSSAAPVAETSAHQAKRMSITVNIYYSGENGAARKFAQEMVASGTVALIRQEKGNLKYHYFFPMDDPETVLLIDSWENQAAIDAHHQSPMMATIMKLREKYNLHMRVERYLSDEGIPDHDKAFIRE